MGPQWTPNPVPKAWESKISQSQHMKREVKKLNDKKGSQNASESGKLSLLKTREQGHLMEIEC